MFHCCCQDDTDGFDGDFEGGTKPCCTVLILISVLLNSHEILSVAFQLLKEEIDSQSRPVTTCLDQLKQLVVTGSEFLSRDEITSIEKKGKQLKTRYDRVNVETERLVRQLNAARDELSKFRMELGTFTNWMEKARRSLEEKERALSNLQRIDSSNDSVKELVSDIISHQADLRFITMAAQKFFDESKVSVMRNCLLKRFRFLSSSLLLLQDHKSCIPVL